MPTPADHALSKHQPDFGGRGHGTVFADDDFQNMVNSPRMENLLQYEAPRDRRARAGHSRGGRRSCQFAGVWVVVASVSILLVTTWESRVLGFAGALLIIGLVLPLAGIASALFGVSERDRRKQLCIWGLLFNLFILLLMFLAWFLFLLHRIDG